MSEVTRILHVVPNMQAGGLETFIMNIYRNIDRSKIQFDFLVHYQGEFFYDDEIRELGGKIYKLSVRDDNNFIKYLKDLKSFFKAHKEYKIVHGHMESLGQFYLREAKKNKIPMRIAHSHNSSTEKTVKGYMKSILLKNYHKYATDLFACSKKAGEYMFGNKRFLVWNNAINIENFLFDHSVRNEIRKELNLEDKFVIGHIGRFCKQKNHKFIIEVFEEVLRKNKNSVLILAGKGELEDSIKELVKIKGIEDKVKFLGVRKDTSRLYMAMDCLLFPSLFEGLGIVAIEAQCSGLPVIASDVIPNEANVTSGFYKLSLSESIARWAEVVNIFNSNANRNNEVEKVRQAGFDIKDMTKKLEKYYLGEI